MDFRIYRIEEIIEILRAKLIGNDNEAPIKYILIDSRKILHPEATLFIAIKGERHDGHEFIAELYDKGVRNFIVSAPVKNPDSFPEANFIQVNDTLAALQQLSAAHRKLYDIPIIAITGSNGKTIVKEWLGQLLHTDKNIVKSPRSFNSQVGVPLSLWQIGPTHELGIFEAGISQPGEMEKLQNTIQPTIGVFTNVGDAHNEGFENQKQKAQEKLKLFKEVDFLVYCKDYKDIADGLKSMDTPPKTFSWSRKSKADLQVNNISIGNKETSISAGYDSRTLKVSIPFTDEASIENAIHCWALLLKMGYDEEFIIPKMKKLSSVAMRMELKEGINNCTIINDSYNSDFGSLEIALDFLNQQKQYKKKVVILSDILQSGKEEKRLYKEVAELLSKKGIDRFMGIGKAIFRQYEQFSTGGSFYESTNDFLAKFSPSLFHDEIILLKGARQFKFEQISKALQQKAHETVLEVNLDAIVHNLNLYRSKLAPETKIMAMVKAFSYGSGSFEIANVLQFHRIDYLAVAYADEGVELRKAGITIPILIMNPEDQTFDTMIQYNLEPEIYSFHVFDLFSRALEKSGQAEIGPVPIHIKLETGMHRLGFEEEDLSELVNKIKANDSVYVQSVFSHLAASEDEKHDEFTRGQIKQFSKLCEYVISKFDYPILRHILNSRGIIRFPEAHFEMVRMGIGIYGVGDVKISDKENATQLQNVSTLKSRISQIKEVKANDTIGYGRKGIARENMKIAIVPIGYADGLNRKLGNGRGKLMVNGQFVPVIGDICMDMCMIDVTNVLAKEGDEIIVFGSDYPVTEFAENLETIPYEVLTSISRRVKRVYFHE